MMIEVSLPTYLLPYGTVHSKRRLNTIPICFAMQPNWAWLCRITLKVQEYATDLSMVACVGITTVFLVWWRAGIEFCKSGRRRRHRRHFLHLSWEHLQCSRFQQLLPGIRYLVWTEAYVRGHCPHEGISWSHIGQCWIFCRKDCTRCRCWYRRVVHVGRCLRCANTCMCSYIHVLIHAYSHTYIHTYTWTYVCMTPAFFTIFSSFCFLRCGSIGCSCRSQQSICMWIHRHG